ncbi:MAG TPA: hypothetical protein VFS43_19575 [Polyangiaceae bacterium]|nr:hypothetical protein [Polyangiaceae bacterium]
MRPPFAAACGDDSDAGAPPFADRFRVEGGLSVEHRDCTQDAVPADPAKNRNGRLGQVTP